MRLRVGPVGVADGHLGGLALVGLVAVALVRAEHAVPLGHVQRVARREGVADCGRERERGEVIGA